VRKIVLYLKHELTEAICIKRPKIFAFVFIIKAQKSIDKTFNKTTQRRVQEGLSTSKNLR
jgi:hypothetical protein